MKQAVQLATDLMEEILAKEFCDPDEGPLSFGLAIDETLRQDYDDVDDYDKWVASPPEDFQGNVLSEYAGFTRSVKVENVDGNDLQSALDVLPGSTEYKVITVRVDWDGDFITLTGLKAYFGEMTTLYVEKHYGWSATGCGTVRGAPAQGIRGYHGYRWPGRIRQGLQDQAPDCGGSDR